jgi:phospholipase/carboxylesterase
LQHIFEQGTKKNTFLLLHGTGGTERDLIGLAREIDAEANILSVRGQVLENGMPRFFKRLAEGVFDMDDLRLRTDELKDFIDHAANDYGFDRTQVIAIGYSNGANIAANLLFRHGAVLKGAMLHHPMVPDREANIGDLSAVKVWAGAGTNDMMCPPHETEELQQLLSDAGANVSIDWFNYGHQLTMPEVQAAKAWYNENF